MFDLTDRPLVWVPVKWPVLRPSEKEGETAVEHEVSIEIEVEIKDRDELVELTSEMFGLDSSKEKELEGLSPEQIVERSRALEVTQFMTLVRDWRKFKAAGKPVEFTAENVRKLLSVPGFLTAFQTAYFNACAGKVETRKGN